MNFDAVYTVKKEFDKDTFLRQLIIELGAKSSTPIDVVDAQFQEVKESIREVIVCSAHIEGNCTASVGYDRQEPYTDYETYKEKVGDSYVTRQRAVTKYRTVTDWRVFQTDYSGNATCAAYNDAGYGTDDSAIVNAIKTANTENIVQKGEAVVNKTGLATAIAACKAQVAHSTVSLPGDRQRDVQYNSNYEIQSVSCYKLPHYEVVYTYDEKEYTASCFACGKMRIEAQTPPNNTDITAAVKEETANLEKQQKLSWLLFTGSLIVSAIICFALKFAWLFPIPILLLLKAKKDSDAYSKEYQACSDRLSKNVAQAKLSALNAALKKHGYEALSQNLSDSLETRSIPGAKELKPIKSRVTWSWVLAVILAIISVFTISSVHKQNLHSPKQLGIDIVSKEVVYDPDASPYINGCYYIHFDYEVEAKKTGIDYVELKVYVSDKNGKELGFIRSSLSGINADPGDKKVVTVTLKENQPENNEFFTTLYNAEFKDLKFKYEIGSIRFTDGEYYHNDDYNEFG